MYKKSITGGIILLFLLSSLIPMVSSNESNESNVIYVDDDGGADYTRIQDAIDNASDGDTIFVYNGIYYEHLNISSKSLVLQGEQKGITIIDAEGSGYALYLKNANDCTISGFTFRNISGLVWFEAGIIVDASHGCLITDNIINNCGHGIWLYKSSDIQITCNNIVDNKEGIVFYDTNGVTLERNNVENSSIVGIYFNGCRTVSIVENNFIDNKRHLTLFGILDVDVDANYWDKLIQWNIKPLLWIPLNIIPIPVLIFDWNPAKEPYDIP